MPEVDDAAVERICSAIERGEYKIDYEKVGRKMLNFEGDLNQIGQLMPPDADFFTALLNDEHHILLALHSAMESELEALRPRQPRRS